MAELSSGQLSQIERAMSQAGLTKESERQRFILWFVNTFSSSERGNKSTSDIKQDVQNWMRVYR